jgi:hypothetical protein
MLIELDLSLEMNIFLFQLLNLFKKFLELHFAFLFTQLGINSFQLFLKFHNIGSELVNNISLSGNLLLKLKLRIKKLIINLLTFNFGLLDPIIMFGLRVAQRFYLTQDLPKLCLHVANLVLC